MKATEFCYWLQGYFEVAGLTGNSLSLTPAQVEMIKRHLAMVFVHDIDPQAGDAEHQAVLQGVHDGKPSQIGGTGPNGEVYRC